VSIVNAPCTQTKRAYQLLVASSTNLFVIPLPPKKTEKDDPEPEWEPEVRGKKKAAASTSTEPKFEGTKLTVERTIERPLGSGTEVGMSGTFRAAKSVVSLRF
jgi:hypothetical protein